MEKLFADTNIFGIAVDRDDSRRVSVWRILERVASGVVELHSERKGHKRDKRGYKSVFLLEPILWELEGIGRHSFFPPQISFSSIQLAR